MSNCAIEDMRCCGVEEYTLIVPPSPKAREHPGPDGRHLPRHAPTRPPAFQRARVCRGAPTHDAQRLFPGAIYMSLFVKKRKDPADFLAMPCIELPN